MKEQKYTFEEFCEIIRKLKGPDGCPWDRVQTHESLIPCMVEEAYEVVEGIHDLTATGDAANLCEELGDVLMQVVLHSAIAEEENLFTLSDVTDGISRKMIHRHPHVFQEDGKKRDWEDLKREEKGNQTPQEELKSIPSAFPALIRAQKVQKKMERLYGLGQDPDKSLESMERIMRLLKTGGEELDKEALLGEVFWQLCNYSRLQGINSEQALVKNIEIMIKTSMQD